MVARTSGSRRAQTAEERRGYQPHVTSYDYRSPLDEHGNPTPAYYAYRKQLAEALPPGTRLPLVSPVFHRRLHLCPHAIANTPALRCGAFVARFPRRFQPPPVSHQLGSHFTLVEACSAFIHIMACVLADRLTATFSTRVLRPRRLPAANAPVASGWSNSLPGGISSSHWIRVRSVRLL